MESPTKTTFTGVDSFARRMHSASRLIAHSSVRAAGTTELGRVESCVETAHAPLATMAMTARTSTVKAFENSGEDRGAEKCEAVCIRAV